MRRLVFSTCAVAMMFAASSALSAPKYPDVTLPKTIQLVVNSTAGGSTDNMVRTLAPFFEKRLKELTGQDADTIVVNLPGAGGEIGWTVIHYGKKDGSTIGAIHLPAVILVEAARGTKFSPWIDNFSPIGLDVIDPNVFSLYKGSKYANLKEAFEAAKAKPGSVVVGADGPLSDDHLAVYAAADAYGAKFSFIPYPGGGAAANKAFQSGEIDIAVGNVFDYLKTKESSKDAMVIRPTRYKAIAAMADVPTMEEVVGIKAADIELIGSVRGWVAPTGLPEDVLKVYREAFALVVNDPDYQKTALSRNITIVEPYIGEEFGKFCRKKQASVDKLLDYFVKGGFVKK